MRPNPLLHTAIFFLLSVSLFLGATRKITFADAKLNCTCDRSQDSLALVALYNATDGSNWINSWNLNEPMHTWHGLVLNQDACVEYLSLSENNLSGVLPPEIGNLCALIDLRIERSGLTGGIPDEIGNLENLKILRLGGNESLGGSLPASIGNLDSLRQIWLWSCNITGPIPSTWSNLQKLGTLILATNQLTGEIPTWLGTLPNLLVLRLDANDLTGGIPSELGSLSALQFLGLSFNDLTGTIPPELGDISTLEELNLFGNALNGSIPSSLGNLTQLTKLYLDGNSLSGEIPASLGGLSNLVELYLHDNNLSGTIPDSLGNLTNLTHLWLYFNKLSGSIPASFGQLTKLKDLLAGANNLSGAIPAALGNLSELERMNLCCQNLTGAIPTSFNNFTKLANLDLNDNNLSGAIPTGLGNDTLLQYIDLSSNELTGSIPSQIGDLKELTYLDLSYNQVENSIPAEIGMLTKLNECRLQSNKLSGAIPASITNLTSLALLDLSLNNLSGTIPAAIGDLSLLVEMDLSFNDLDGEIPGSIGNLSLIKTLGLSDNRLSGAIPPLNTMNSLQNLYLSNNQLSGSIPAALGANIENFWLDNNNLSGTIPSSIGSLSALHTVKLNDNTLEGGFPSALFNTTDIKWIFLQNAGLSGELPVGFDNLDYLEILSLHGNAFTGEIPAEFIDMERLRDLYLQNNQFSGCIPTAFSNLCGINVDISDNPNLAAGDNFQAFCTTASGSCAANYECADALALPLSYDPCARNYVAVRLYEATTSTPSPISGCAASFVGKDVWFQVVVPATGSFLIKNDSISTIRPAVEVYEGDCGSLIYLDCAELDSLPFVLALENQTPGSTIYIRAWDQNNTIADVDTNAVLALSAHTLSADKEEWELCDFPIAILNDTLGQGAGNRAATQFIVQFDSATTQMTIDSITADLEAEGASLLKECPCKDTPLQLWTSGSPIKMEIERRVARNKSRVDTSNYNYFIEEREIQGNTIAEGQQEAASVGIDENGNFIIAWQDRDDLRILETNTIRTDVFGQLFNENGSVSAPDFRLNTTVNFNQDNPQIAMRPDGSFIAVWMDGNYTRKIRGQLFHADGNKNGKELAISDPQLGYNPSVGMDADGNFIVVWEAPDGSGLGVYGQRFNEAGEKVGGLFEVNFTTFEQQHQAAAAMNASGEFVSVWQSRFQDGSNYGVFARKFDRAGTPLALEFQVNTFTAGNQRFPAIDINASGAFVAAWQSSGQDGSDEGVYARLFDANAQAISPEIPVNTYTTNTQSNPAVAMYNDGGFVVTWESFGQDGSGSGIFAQLFDEQGNKLGEELPVNTFTEGTQVRPDIAMNDVGDIIVSWESFGQDGSASGIFGQRYQTQGAGAAKTIVPVNDPTLSAGLGILQRYADNPYLPLAPQDSVKVGVMDTGVQSDHPEVVNALWMNPEANDADNCLLEDEIGYDFVNFSGNPIDLDGHGTGVNGMIVRNFPTGVQLELINLKFYENQRGTIFDAICAIYYAVEEGVDILNLSWGFESDEFPQILYDALQYASDKDVLLISSAGNTAKNNDLINKYPANFDLPNLIVVTAYQLGEDSSTVRLADYASFGPTKVDLAALGYVETTALGDSLDAFIGTSLAAPAVSRTAAVIRGLYPALSAGEIKDCILSSVDLVAGLDTLIASGGILNHEAALQCAAEKESICLMEDLFVEDTLRVSEIFQTTGAITGNAVVETDVSITFNSADSIILTTDFHALPGATFSATISDCSDPQMIAPSSQGNAVRPKKSAKVVRTKQEP